MRKMVERCPFSPGEKVRMRVGVPLINQFNSN